MSTSEMDPPLEAISTPTSSKIQEMLKFSPAFAWGLCCDKKIIQNVNDMWDI